MFLHLLDTFWYVRRAESPPNETKRDWMNRVSEPFFFPFWLLVNLLPLITEERDGKILIDHPVQLLLSAKWFPVLHFIFLLRKKFKEFALVPIWVYFIALFHAITSTQGILNNVFLSFPFYLPDICRVLCFPLSHCVASFSLSGIGRAVRPIYNYGCPSLLVLKSCFMLLSLTLIIWAAFLLSTWMSWGYFFGQYWTAQVILLWDLD